MYKSGHVGVALLAYAPLGSLLVGTGRSELAVVAGVVMVALSTLPDADHWIPFVNHRGFTHTLPFAVFVGLAVGVVGAAAGPAVLSSSAASIAALGVVVGTLSILSHIAADSVTPMGIRPFWPLSGWHVTFDVVPAKDPVANFVLLGAGVVTIGMTTILAIRIW